MAGEVVIAIVIDRAFDRLRIDPALNLPQPPARVRAGRCPDWS